MPNILETLPKFHQFLEHELSLRQQTRKGYLSDVRLLYQVFDGDVTDINLKTMRAYKTYLSKRGDHVNTQMRRLNAISTYCKFLMFEGLITRNYALDIPKTRRTLPAATWLGKEEIRRLLATDGDARMKAFIGLCLFLGLRSGEAHHLKWDDVKNGYIVVKDTKGKEDRELRIPAPLAALLEDLPHDDELVVGEWHPMKFRKAFGDHVARAGVRKITPKVLRHTFASHLMARSKNIILVQRALGHRDIGTTKRYTHQDPRMLADEVAGLADEMAGDE